MTDGLKDTHRAAIVNLLRANKRVERAVLFGSRAKQTFTPASDVDIALFGKALTITDQGHLAAAMEELTIPQRVDLLLYHRIENATLCAHVLQDGIELYRRQESTFDNSLNIPEKYRRVLISLLQEHLPGVEVWAYGSCVNGRRHDGSALDLVLRGPELKEMPAGHLNDFEEALRESTIPFLVEARDWARLPERFHREIERAHMLLTNAAGEIHPKWPRVALGDIIDLRLSNVDKKTKPNETPVRLCNYTDVYYNSTIRKNMSFMEATASDREVAKCALSSGDVIITKDSEKYDDIGVPAFVIDNVPDLVCGYHLAILRPDAARIHGRYLFYALITRDIQMQFHHFANGITRFGLRKADIGLVEIPLPSLEEQHAIAHILGALDDKIELNQEINRTLEEIAKAIFKSWFVDFDPVRAKAEGRPTGLPPEISDLFPNELVESEIGEIPKGWEIDNIRSLGTLFKKSINPASSDEIFAHYSIPAFDDGKNPSLDVGPAIKSSKTMVPDGALLVSKLNPNNPRVWIPSLCSSFRKVCSTEFMVFQPTLKSNRNFLWAMFSEKKLQARLESMVTGTSKSHQRVKPTDVLNIHIPCSPNNLIEIFGMVTESLINRIMASKEESLVLSELRDTLLPKLISGELRIQDAEKFLAKANI